MSTPAAPRARDWFAFQGVAGLVGLALTFWGVFGVTAGVSILPGSSATFTSDATLQSVFAFQSALMVGLGLSFVIVALRPGSSGILLAALSFIVFLGGLAQLFAWMLHGTPHPGYVALVIAELVIPPVLLIWFAWIRRSRTLREATAPEPQEA